MICSIPPTVSVLPAINSNHTHHISAGLANGTSIAGQVNISHPSAPTSLPDDALSAPFLTAADHDRIEDANLPGSLPVLRRQHIAFSKHDEEDLPARITRVWYINPYGHEIWPVANPKVLNALHTSSVVIYSIGSLYTSIVPSLILRGVGAAIANDAKVRHRILVLNSKLDRETGPRTEPMTARGFVEAIVRAGAESWTPSRGGGVGGERERERGREVRRYVTHLVYLDLEEEEKGNEKGDAPRVDVDELERLGVRCIKVKARRVVGDGMLRYDERALGEALEGIIES
jgi:hypothetical protein